MTQSKNEFHGALFITLAQVAYLFNFDFMLSVQIG